MADVVFCGESFALAEQVSALAMMEFAHAVSSGADTDTLEGMSAMYAVLQQMLADGEWPRFKKAANTHRASDDALLEFIGEAMAAITARPTERPSDSSDGPVTTEPLSPVVSSSPVIDRLEKAGRPDLALMVSRTQESLAG